MFMLLPTFACDNISIGKHEGANLELIKSTITRTLLIIDEDEWKIDENSIEAITIVSQETTKEKDVVIIDVELKDVVLSATGQMQVEFKYNEAKEGWDASAHRVSTPFTTSFLPHAALNFSNDALISEMVKYSIVYNEIAARTAEQIMLDNIAAGIVGSIIGMPFLPVFSGDQTPQDGLFMVVFNRCLCSVRTYYTFSTNYCRYWSKNNFNITVYC